MPTYFSTTLNICLNMVKHFYVQRACLKKEKEKKADLDVVKCHDLMPPRG